MVPGQLSLSEREQNLRADCRLQEETAAALHSSYEKTKTVPPATAEEIQGLTSYPENFLFRGHRKCIDSVHLSVV